MKIYEKPLVDIRTFDVEDVMVDASKFVESNTAFGEITGGTDAYDGVVFEW